MAIHKQTWNDLLMTPSSVASVKYTDNEWLNGLVHLVVEGSYEKFFDENPELRLVVSENPEDSDLNEIITKLNHNSDFLNLLRLLIGISYLQLFVINNFIGPKTILKNVESDQTHRNEMLICDGETPVSTGEQYEYLCNALKVFRMETSQHWIFTWWKMRCLFIHQKMIEERSMTLCEQIQNCIDQLSKSQSEMNKIEQLLFSIEVTYISQFYFNWKQAESAKNEALSLSSLEINLTGQLGKRTRYQVKNTSQLLLDIVRKESEESSKSENGPSNKFESVLPRDLSLTDDVVLNEIQFENGNDYSKLTLQLNEIEQLTLLLIIQDRQVNNPRHEITTEEQLAFLTYILAHPRNWCVETSSLILRCQHETENKRKIERTLLQLQELIDQYNYEKPRSSFRLEHFHSTPLFPMWKLKSDVANIYVKLGMINDALDLYLYLKKWTDVINCYQILKKLSLAEDVIREQLKIKETPDLLCSLGEVTNEFEHFQRAWELSKHRNGRAQRLMGKYFFNRGNYEKACEHLVKAVEINSLQHDTWFWLGSAAFRTEKWELGIRAYSRCTNIEPDNFEAWNNLAACHTKLKQIDKAHKVFLEAIKCNYDNWKVWENFLWTSADCGEIDDMIQAYHRLIDLKKKYFDQQVLQRLVQLLTESEQNDVWKKIHQKSLELFGRLTSEITNETILWELYSDLCQLKRDERSVDWDTKILQQLQRAHRCATSQNWQNQIETLNDVVRISIKLAQNTIERSAEHLTNEDFKSLCHSIRLSLNGVLTRLKQKYDSSLNTTDQGLNEKIKDLEKFLLQLTDILKTT